MTIFVAILLTVLTFAFVVYPFFKKRSPSADSIEDEKLQELHSKRDTTYSMLKELEFDFQSGILTEEDYHDLEALYKRKAISILRETDDLRKRRLQSVKSEDSLDQKRQKLLVELAQLDDDFEDGKIPEDVYRRLRATRKAQLVELMSGPKEEPDDR